MAIQVRRGLEKDFDANKMLPGELAVTTDTRKIYATFAPGDCKRMATYEDMQEDINLATEDIISNLTEGVSEVIEQAETATSAANQSVLNANNAKAAAETATQEANQATANAQAAAETALEAAGQISDKLSKEDITAGDNVTITETEEGRLEISSTGETNIATTEQAGIVKASEDVTVSVDGSMSLNTDFEVPEALIALASGEQWNTILGKIGKLIEDAINETLNGYETQGDVIAHDINGNAVSLIDTKAALEDKQDTITGAATAITSSDLTASRALISNASGKVAASTTTNTELGYVHGVTSAIQTQLNNKLPITGGTLTGNLSLQNKKVIYFYSDNNSPGYIQSIGNQALRINASSETAFGLHYGVRDNIWTLTPYSTNGSQNLGSPTYKWANIYAANGTINTSDRNMKENICYLEDDDIWTEFFMRLLPVSFIFKGDEHDRTHIGFIAQDVEDAMSELGLTSLDFAGLCKDQKVISNVVKEIVIDEETGEEREVEKIVEEVVEGEYIYSLRYHEFIALITKAVQNSHKRIDDLEDRLSRLEGKIG